MKLPQSSGNSVSASYFSTEANLKFDLLAQSSQGAANYTQIQFNSP